MSPLKKCNDKDQNKNKNFIKDQNGFFLSRDKKVI